MRDWVRGAVGALLTALAAAAWWFRRLAQRQEDRAEQEQARADRAESEQEVARDARDKRQDVERAGADSARQRLRDDWTAGNGGGGE